MGAFTGLTVDVISDHKILKLYDDPDDEPANDPRIRQRYIEAVTGATFKVRISIQKRFRLYTLKPDDAVRVHISYDNMERRWYHDFVVSDIRHMWSIGGQPEYTFWSINKFDETTQQWRQGATTFGALETNDTADVKASVDEIKKLGQIKITVQRVHRTKRVVPLHTPPICHKPITEVSEKMLKGKAIFNSVRTTNEILSQAPSPTTHDTAPILGVDGQMLTTLIFYRPRHTLQMLGCIPRSPSPEPESSTHDLNAASREREIQNLRAQLALLEGDANIKPEGPDVKTRIKREIRDTEELQITEARSAKKPRHSGPVETVDLT